jgi:long-chain acyl-CoA synthetase
MQTIEIDGLSLRVYEHAPRDVRTLFDNCEKWPDRPYIHFEEEILTFGDLNRDAPVLAGALYHRFGIRKGDRVAIVMRNYPEWAVSFWATILLGAVVVPVNAWGTGPEMAYVLGHSGAEVIIADAERLERLSPHFRDLKVRAIVAVRAPDVKGDLVHAYAELVDAHRNSLSAPNPNLSPDDMATILYTSGTTGRPKGAVSTHRNIVSAIVNGTFNGALSHMRKTGMQLSPDPIALPPKYLNGVPLFQVGGCNSGLAASMAGGASIVLMYRWNAGKALDLIERLRITGVGCVPTMMWQLLEHSDFAKHDLSSLTSVAIGGAAAGPELHARLTACLPHVVPATGYGATETSGGCTYNGGIDYAMRPTGVGIPAPILDVKAVDNLGREVPPNVAGELCFRGACVLRRYWKDPEASTETFRDGWFHSGDIGSIDEEGRITILDRAKDMVIRGGENVYSIEVEDVLLAHSDVIAAAVFGIPDPMLGENVAATVQVRPGASVAPASLQSFVAGRLARFKVPSLIVVTHDELPKNETGKILKRVLRMQIIGERRS